ncbi:MAG: hypothetical protein ACRDOK_25665, partial [Streptosporangiaceae bacterium]
SVGDLIICRQNDRSVEAGEPGRTLANGDLLRIEAIRGRTLLVRRALDFDPVAGERRWTDRAFEYGGYATADLGYAVTGHSAQGRSVQVGIPVVTGTEDRQWLYVAMTWGAESNTMMVFTRSAKVADPAAGTRPAPELQRHERVERERAGLPAAAAAPVEGGPQQRDAIAVAADILDVDGSESSALETQGRALANADHLAVLNAMWQGETAGIQTDRYRQLVRAALPPQYAAEQLTSPQATWLWRTLRGVETTGLDVGEVVHEAVRSRSLAGARDLASVIDARIRLITGSLVPQPLRPWSERMPAVAEPERKQFLTELAAAIDARKERIGEHVAEHAPEWAIRPLGKVPDDPLDRLEWQRRAAEIGAYRELYGYGHPTEPIGPEPSGDSPEKRAAWHAAFAALGPVDGVDLRGLPDGSLLHIRGTYETETAWASRHVGRELQRLRISADDASLAAIRAHAEERIACHRGDLDVANRHATLARSYTAMERLYREHESELEQTMEVRREWERATEQTRRLAVAADAELRRRHPGQRFEPLRSAEPLVTEDERNQLELAPGAEHYETPAWITRLAAERRTVRGRLDERKAVRVPSADPKYEPEGEAWPEWIERDRDAILQPPKPEMRPTPGVLQRVPDLQAER